MSDYPNAGKQPLQAQPDIVRLGEPLKVVSSLDTPNLMGNVLSHHKENLPASATSARTSGHLQISRAEYAALQQQLIPIARRMVSKAGLPDINSATQEAAGDAISAVYSAHCKDLESADGVKQLHYYLQIAKNVINRYIDYQKRQSGYISIKTTTKDVHFHMSLEDMYDYAHRETGLSHRHLSPDEMRAWVMNIVSPPQNAEKPDCPEEDDVIDIEDDQEVEQDTEKAPVSEKPKKKIRPPRVGIFQSTEYLDEDGESSSLIEQVESTHLNIDAILEKKQLREIIISSWKDCIRLLTRNQEKTETYTTAFEMYWTSQSEDGRLTAKDVAEQLNVSEASISTMFQAIYGCLKMKLIEQRAIDYLKVSASFKRASVAIHQYPHYSQAVLQKNFFDKVGFSKSICFAQFCSLNNISEAYVLKLHYRYKSKIQAWIDLCIQVEKYPSTSNGLMEIPAGTLSEISALALAM